jgi:thiamine pyrophosphate-dependent acetolactate synthase large subunit-like protein
MLERQGVKHIFGLPGGAAIPLFDVLVDSSLHLGQTRHEQDAVQEADVSGISLPVVKHSYFVRNAAGGTPRDWISRAQKLTCAHVLATMTMPRSVKCSLIPLMTSGVKESGVEQMHST